MPAECVKVIVRMRPFNQREKENGSKACVIVYEDTNSVELRNVFSLYISFIRIKIMKLKILPLIMYLELILHNYKFTRKLLLIWLNLLLMVIMVQYLHMVKQVSSNLR